MQFGSDDLAKYTFLPEAGDFIRAQGIELSDLSRPDYVNVVNRARERIVEAITKGRVSDQIAKNKEIEIMSFPVSLVLVRSTNLDHLMSLYAGAEASRVEYFLSNERNPRIIEDIFKDYIGVELEHTSGKGHLSAYYSTTSNLFLSLPPFRIPIMEYLKRAVGLRKPEWKLVNRMVSNGKVFVTQEDIIHLIREEIKAMIYQRLKDTKLAKLPENLERISKEIIKMAPPPRESFTILKVGPENYPPCVREALKLLEKGENVPHYGRFLLATYLLRVGKSVDDIVALFPKAPNFKQNVTRYQVEHIAGLKGGRTKYSVPSCKTLQTHSFCFMDPIKCRGISSPLQYPADRRRSRMQDEGTGRGEEEEARKGSQPNSNRERERAVKRNRRQTVDWT